MPTKPPTPAARRRRAVVALPPPPPRPGFVRVGGDHWEPPEMLEAELWKLTQLRRNRADTEGK
jgi:hypothetical protein